MTVATKAVLRGNITALNTYIRKEERLQMNDLSFQLRKLEEEKQIKYNIKSKNRNNEYQSRNCCNIKQKKNDEAKGSFFKKSI